MMEHPELLRGVPQVLPEEITQGVCTRCLSVTVVYDPGGASGVNSSTMLCERCLGVLALKAQRVRVELLMAKNALPPSLRALLIRIKDVHPDDLPASLKTLRSDWIAAGCPLLKEDNHANQ